MRIPKLRRHATGQAFTKLYGRNRYFGKWPEGQARPPLSAQRAFDEFIGRELRKQTEDAPRPKAIQDPFIFELWTDYFAHCKNYYVKRGKETTEVGVIQASCGIVDKLFGDRLARNFTAMDLEQCRREMVKLGWSRSNINKQVQRVRGMFKWGIAQGLVPAIVLTELKCLAPLKRGRTSAPEAKPIRAVPWATVEKTLTHLRPPLDDLVRAHWLLGCRADEVCEMKAGEIRQVAGSWMFEPSHWKTEHHENDKLVYWIGPRAMEIIGKAMAGKKADDYLFPCWRRRRGRQREGAEATPYSTASYRRSVAWACQKHHLERWSPLQVRHGRLTEIRAAHGAEASQTVARHSNLKTTEIYAERNHARAREIMAEMG